MIDYDQLAVDVERRARIVARHEHEYVNAAGEPVHRTVRLDCSDGTKTVWQQRFEHGRWVNGLGQVETVLYRLPRVLEKAASGGLVLLVEGERVVEVIETLGIVATTAAMGAGKWFDALAVPLVGAYVVICPDCDLQGRRHMVEAGCSLLGAGAVVFGPLELNANLQDGEDLYDHLAGCADTFRDVSPGLDRKGIRDSLRRHLQRMVWQCPPATRDSLAGYLERAEWRIEPRGRVIRHCDRCKRDRPHSLAAGLAYCPCGHFTHERQP